MDREKRGSAWCASIMPDAFDTEPNCESKIRGFPESNVPDQPDKPPRITLLLFRHSALRIFCLLPSSPMDDPFQGELDRLRARSLHRRLRQMSASPDGTVEMAVREPAGQFRLQRLPRPRRRPDPARRRQGRHRPLGRRRGRFAAGQRHAPGAHRAGGKTRAVQGHGRRADVFQRVRGGVGGHRRAGGPTRRSHSR